MLYVIIAKQLHCCLAKNVPTQ